MFDLLVFTYQKQIIFTITFSFKFNKIEDFQKKNKKKYNSKANNINIAQELNQVNQSKTLLVYNYIILNQVNLKDKIKVNFFSVRHVLYYMYPLTYKVTVKFVC